MKTILLHLRSVFYALAGFTLWSFSDTCMKLAGEAHLPPYEIVGFLGLFSGASLIFIYGCRGRAVELWPKQPRKQLPRVLMLFGCLMGNAVALAHLPLTVFYVVVFTAPIMIAILAAAFLHEHLSGTKILAIIVGFSGVIIAIDPWNMIGKGDWIGYGAAAFASLLYATSTVMTRFMTQAETSQSMAFMTALCQTVLSGCLMLWHAVPVTWHILAIMGCMGVLTGIGNLFNISALKHTTAASVEQFHYSQIVLGALLGYLIWGDVPTLQLLIGSAVIIASGLYVAASIHRAEKRAAAAAVI